MVKRRNLINKISDIAVKVILGLILLMIFLGKSDEPIKGEGSRALAFMAVLNSELKSGGNIQEVFEKAEIDGQLLNSTVMPCGINDNIPDGMFKIYYNEKSTDLKERFWIVITELCNGESRALMSDRRIEKIKDAAKLVGDDEDVACYMVECGKDE